MVWKTEILPGQTPDLPRLLIGMSFSEVSLGGLLSSRARLRFPRRTQFCNNGLPFVNNASANGKLSRYTLSHERAHPKPQM